MDWMLVLFGVLGVCVGSFLNVVIIWTHDETSFIKGRSVCRFCNRTLALLDLIPVVSYVFLRGRCRSCQTHIPLQYLAVEVITGLLFLMVYLVGGGWLEVIRHLVFVSILVIIFVYDLRHMLILDRFTIPAMIFAVIANLWLGVIPVWSLLAGGIVVSGFFWVQYAFSRGQWVGGGDIRMGALMGLMLGLQHGLVALFLAYVLGSVVSVFLIAIKKVSPKTPIPFGTFLATSTVTVLFFGQQMIDWYLGFFL